MFTGLIQATGTIERKGSDRVAITVTRKNAPHFWQDLELGDSVAVDGVCLTVEEVLPLGFLATASPETLNRTNLEYRAQSRQPVNLETALRVGGKVGGHFVTGHVDGVGSLLEVTPTETSWLMNFGPVESLQKQWEQHIARLLIPKGSIAVNGISLTIAECDSLGQWFKVAVIPHTYQETNLSSLKPGHWVNLESDLLGKYVAKLMGHTPPMAEPESISLTFLQDHGYF